MRFERPLIPRLVAWEATRACQLACIHCRAEAQRDPDPQQLTTAEAIRLVDEIAEFAQPIFIMTGGDPLLREDIFEVARYASGRGLKVVMSPGGRRLDAEIVEEMREAGVRRISMSIDGSRAEIHDGFRAVSGAFEAAIESVRRAGEGGLAFQINTTVTSHNLDDLPNMLELAVELGAAAWDVFMLVPTGRGRQEMSIRPEQCEEVLNFVHRASLEAPISVKMTCCPHFVRVQRGGESSKRRAFRGCMAGNGFCFVSHTGEVFGCGYLPLAAGNVRRESFKQIYQNSPLFLELRNYKLLRGKCGFCEYRAVCGGCRARALAISGDYLGEEPLCIYEPKGGLSAVTII